MESNNPVFNSKTLAQTQIQTQAQAAAGVMTVEGTINKTGILFLLMVASSAVSWNLADSPIGMMLALGAVIANLVLCLILVFNKPMAPTLAPVYALVEGLALGAVSAWADRRHPGLAFNAMVLTMGCLGLMLGLYRFQIVRATERFRSVVTGATLAIGVTYLLDLALMWAGYPMPMIHEGGPMGILFSLIVVAIAAFNLILDFDMIEQATRQRAPKYFEWYAGFALLVTIVWLYLEILRLLSKSSRR